VIPCRKCGIDLAIENKFCPECGSKIMEQSYLIDFENLIRSLTEKHLKLLSGYGNSRDDRGLVEHSVTKILDEVCFNFYGANFYESFDPKTRLGGIFINDEFEERYLPLIIDHLLHSNEVPQNILPIVSNFLLHFCQFAHENSNFFNSDLKNEIILNSLQDNLSDQNLTVFYDAFWFQIFVDFYTTEYPDEKEVFFESLQNMKRAAKPGEIDYPQNHDPSKNLEVTFEGVSDRQELWSRLVNYYQQGLYPQKFKVQDFLGLDGLSDARNYIVREFPEFLDYEYLAFFYCKPELSGKDYFLIFTDKGICYFPMKAKHMKGKPSFYPVHDIEKITIGEEIHESHGGFTSSTSNWMLLTIFTKQFQQYARYIPDGSNEQEMNEIRPSRMEDLNKISRYYQLEEGESYQSASGFSLSPSIGVWGPIGGND
jgi:hypothetical protein